VQNNPLHVQPTEDDAASALKFDYITFVGLDAVDNVLMEHKERSASLFLTMMLVLPTMSMETVIAIDWPTERAEFSRAGWTYALLALC
jgi:hypothetical protein